jgi:HK97 gp10 family phage protein
MSWDVEFDSKEFARAAKAELANIDRKTTGPALDRVGDAMARRAREIAPKRTGELARGIDWRRSGRDEVEIRSSSDHSIYVEYGTSNMKAEPYMRPMWAEAPGIFSRQMSGVL